MNKTKERWRNVRQGESWDLMLEKRKIKEVIQGQKQFIDRSWVEIIATWSEHGSLMKGKDIYVNKKCDQMAVGSRFI